MTEAGSAIASICITLQGGMLLFIGWRLMQAIDALRELQRNFLETRNVFEFRVNVNCSDGESDNGGDPS